MKEPISKLINSTLRQATKWLSVSDIGILTTSSRSTVRKCLNRNLALYQSMRIPGDRHGANQWAVAGADTTGWADADPSPFTPKQINKTRTTNLPPRSVQLAIYRGMSLMCAPANKSSLIKAVGDLLVNEFVTSGKKFSAYDITKRLREMVLEEAQKQADQMSKLPPGYRQTFTVLLDLNEQGTVHVQGLKVAKVEHEDVKAIVHDIFNAGGMPSLSRRRDATDIFWEYDPTSSLLGLPVVEDDPPAVTGSTTDPDPISGGTMSSTYDGTSTI